MFRITHVVAFAGLLAALPFAGAEQAQARIKCDGGFQVVRGQGHIATPYCQDNYLARVARKYGIRVSGAAIRKSASRKEDICRAIGHDGRVSSICQQYRTDSCHYKRC